MAKVLPREGKWTVRNERFIDGKTLGHWGLLDFANINERAFVEALRTEGRARGLAVEYPAAFKKCSDILRVEPEFVALYQKLAETRKPDMIMVVVPVKDTTAYSSIKALGDTLYGIPTQVVLKKNATIGPKSSQTVHNICLKINSKLGGVNQIIHLDHRPDILKRPVSSFLFLIFFSPHFACWQLPYSAIMALSFTAYT